MFKNIMDVPVQEANSNMISDIMSEFNLIQEKVPNFSLSKFINGTERCCFVSQQSDHVGTAQSINEFIKRVGCMAEEYEVYAYLMFTHHGKQIGVLFLADDTFTKRADLLHQLKMDLIRFRESIR